LQLKAKKTQHTEHDSTTDNHGPQVLPSLLSTLSLPQIDLLYLSTAPTITPPSTSSTDPVSSAFASHILPLPIRTFTKFLNPLLLEAPCFGLPGYSNFLKARSVWTSKNIDIARAAGATQVVFIGAGLDPMPYVYEARTIVSNSGHNASSNRYNNNNQLQWYEVDKPEVLRQKRSAAKSCLPGGLPLNKSIDIDNWEEELSIKLIPSLTAAGFDPNRRTCVVIYNVVAKLSGENVGSLFTDLMHLLAPGSRIVLDFVFDDKISTNSSGGTTNDSGTSTTNCSVPGRNAYSALHAAKNEPIVSPSLLKPSFSEAVKYFQQYQFRVMEVLKPDDIGQLPTDHNSNTTTSTSTTTKKKNNNNKNNMPAQFHEVPMYMGLIALTKINPRLMLKHHLGDGELIMPHSSPSSTTRAGVGAGSDTDNNMYSSALIKSSMCVFQPILSWFCRSHNGGGNSIDNAVQQQPSLPPRTPRASSSTTEPPVTPTTPPHSISLLSPLRQVSSQPEWMIHASLPPTQQ